MELSRLPEKGEHVKAIVKGGIKPYDVEGRFTGRVISLPSGAAVAFLSNLDTGKEELIPWSLDASKVVFHTAEHTDSA